MSKSTPVWIMDERPYLAMRRRHAALWRFLPAFIKEFGVRSLIEIGCGTAELAPLVPRYLGIDLNRQIAAWAQPLGRHVVNADWLTMSMQHLEGTEPDLVLAAAVVEHCADYRPFVDRMLALKPRFVIVTFFLGVDGTEDVIRPREENGITYYENHYAFAGVIEFLQARGLTAPQITAVQLPTRKQAPDFVMILNPGERADRLQCRVDRLAQVAIGGERNG